MELPEEVVAAVRSSLARVRDLHGPRPVRWVNEEELIVCGECSGGNRLVPHPCRTYFAMDKLLEVLPEEAADHIAVRAPAVLLAAHDRLVMACEEEIPNGMLYNMDLVALATRADTLCWVLCHRHTEMPEVLALLNERLPYVPPQLHEVGE